MGCAGMAFVCGDKTDADAEQGLARNFPDTRVHARRVPAVDAAGIVSARSGPVGRNLLNRSALRRGKGPPVVRAIRARNWLAGRECATRAPADNAMVRNCVDGSSIRRATRNAMEAFAVDGAPD